MRYFDDGRRRPVVRGDAVEALIQLGRLAEAQPLIDTLEHNGARLDRAWMLAVGVRCRAMLLAAQGDVDAAIQTAQRRWPNTTGCQCRSTGRELSFWSANFSVGCDSGTDSSCGSPSSPPRG